MFALLRQHVQFFVSAFRSVVRLVAALLASPFRSAGMLAAILLALTIAIPVATLQAQTEIVRVDITNDIPFSQQDGDSWSTAYQYLQDGLDRADQIFIDLPETEAVQIWVAQGTYYPDQGQTIPPPELVNPRELSFHLRNNVELYGGFVGNEQNRFERDPETNLTILSGNIGDTEDDSDNSYHVVQAINVDDSAMLNGFVVRDGFADGPGQETNFDREGAGIITQGASPLIIRCVITENKAQHGAGITEFGPADPWKTGTGTTK